MPDEKLALCEQHGAALNELSRVTNDTQRMIRNLSNILCGDEGNPQNGYVYKTDLKLADMETKVASIGKINWAIITSIVLVIAGAAISKMLGI